MNARRAAWWTEDASEFCGPEHLARAVHASREWDPAEESEGQVSRDGLTRLVELCYRISLSTEEGRHPRFAVFVPAPASESHMALVARLDPPVTLDAQALRRLVPSIPAGDHALCVRESGDALVATGIMGLRDPDDVSRPGRPGVSFGVGLPGFTLRVDGPGMARATEKGLTWELNTGHVRPVSHFGTLRPVQDWFERLSLSLVREIRERDGEAALHEREELGDPALVFESVWSYVLGSTVATGHGGAFAVLPDDDEACLRLKYRAADVDVHAAVLRYWRACFDSRRVADGAELERLSARWEAARRWMYSTAKAVANLANVDGCVALDPGMRVLGFGAEIRVPEEGVLPSSLQEANPSTLEPYGEVDLQQFGTRHRSAFRLCAKRPGTTVFVVSQDRDLRVFHGRRDRPGTVCLWQSLGAWMSGFPA